MLIIKNPEKEKKVEGLTIVKIETLHPRSLPSPSSKFHSITVGGIESIYSILLLFVLLNCRREADKSSRERQHHARIHYTRTEASLILHYLSLLSTARLSSTEIVRARFSLCNFRWDRYCDDGVAAAAGVTA